jgi:hypothetical protein
MRRTQHSSILQQWLVPTSGSGYIGLAKIPVCRSGAQTIPEIGDSIRRGVELERANQADAGQDLGRIVRRIQ